MTDEISYIGYIYKTSNLVNNKIYIGKRQKSKFDNYYIGSGKKLKCAIKCYGEENFKCEVIQWCFTLDELNIAEKYWINKYDAQNPEIGYNISDGGNGGDIFSTLDPNRQDELRKKYSLYGKKNKGKCRIYRYVDTNTEVKFIYLDELDSYLAAGWLHGLEPELAMRQGNIRKGRKQSEEWINNRKISIENRSAGAKEHTRQLHSEAAKRQMEQLSPTERSELGKKARRAALAKLNGQKAVWIHKNNQKKLVGEDTVEGWIKLGWERGMK